MQKVRLAPALSVALILGLAAPAVARAHAVTHEVIRARAIAVRAATDDGDPLADCAYQVFSPADAKRPWATGRTDRAGSLAFLPDVPGIWRVKVISDSGHGFATDVSVDLALAPAAQAAPPGPPVAPPAAPPGEAPSRGWLRKALEVLSPAVTILLLFAILWLVQHRRREGDGRKRHGG